MRPRPAVARSRRLGVEERQTLLAARDFAALSPTRACLDADRLSGPCIPDQVQLHELVSALAAANAGLLDLEEAAREPIAEPEASHEHRDGDDDGERQPMGLGRSWRSSSQGNTPPSAFASAAPRAPTRWHIDSPARLALAGTR